MKYEDIKRTGEKIHEYDVYGAGPYQDAYAGSVETWLMPDGSVYTHVHHENHLAYTGETTTYYRGTTTRPDDLRKRLAACNANGAGYDPDTGADVDEIIQALVQR